MNFLLRRMKRVKTRVLKDERRLPSSRWNSRLLFTVLFWSGVVFLVFLTTQSYVRTGFINQKVNGYQDETTDRFDQITTKSFSNSPAGEAFGKDFIERLINIPEDAAGRKKRSESLQTFLAEGLENEQLEDITDFSGKRELKQVYLREVQDVTRVSAQYVYHVSYETSVFDKEGGDKGGMAPTLSEVLVVVPLGTDGTSFNVVEQPYFKAVPGESRLSAVEDDTPSAEKNIKAEDELKRFATQFFTSYTENTVSEMAYLMEEPESLKDLYFYRGAENFRVYDGEKEGTYIIKTLAVFEQSETGLKSKHPFTLVVEKKQDKYYVTSLKHTIGGE
jgi:Conjugative transposon protein TcpC